MASVLLALNIIINSNFKEFEIFLWKKTKGRYKSCFIIYYTLNFIGFFAILKTNKLKSFTQSN